ncbi:hypothetical protein H8959_019042 [Pygathrix nigripes]
MRLMGPSEPFCGCTWGPLWTMLVSGDVCMSGGRRCRMRMSTEGGVCVCECVQSLSQGVSSSDFCPPTLTPVPTSPPQGSLPLVHTGSCPTSLSELEKGIGATPRKQD